MTSAPPRLLCFLVALLSLTLVAAPLRAGDLGDFEKAATERKSSPPPSRSESSSGSGHSSGAMMYGDENSGCESDSFFGFAFCEFFSAVFVQTGKLSLERAGAAVDHPLGLGVRAIGDPDLPVLAADLNYQWVHPDISAVDVRGEVGWGPVGFQVRETHYDETSPRDNLDLVHLHGLYRISGGRAFQMNLGLGGLILSGHRTHNGFSMTLPFSIYPWQHWGVRVTPTWSWIAGNQISDYDGSIEYVQPLWSARVGYRIVSVHAESLHGPYVGVSYHY